MYPSQGWPHEHAGNGYHHYQSSYLPPPQSSYLHHGNGGGYPQPPYGYHPGPSNNHHGFLPPPDELYPGPAAPAGSYTRNLIGSLTASAFRLKDDKDVLGIWFILQDLSIRTEGRFRLKFSFLNLGTYFLFRTGLTSRPTSLESHRGTPGVSLHTGRSKVLCTAMSVPFTVFSAKKFPGMIESTELSKKFAAQGIRIPVRHSAEKKSDDEEEEEVDD
jgi:hypothetical protein